MSKKLFFSDECDNTILYSELTELNLKEDYVLKQAVIRFNDYEPCIIHRTLIIKNFYIKFYNLLEELKGQNINNEFLWSNIPEEIADAINFNKSPYKLIVKD